MIYINFNYEDNYKNNINSFNKYWINKYNN